MFLLRVSRSVALMKSGSSLPSSTSLFRALLLTSTDLVMSQSVASAISAGPAVARSRNREYTGVVELLLGHSSDSRYGGNVELFVYLILVFLVLQDILVVYHLIFSGAHEDDEVVRR